jgi:hypothetical protein
MSEEIIAMLRRQPTEWDKILPTLCETRGAFPEYIERSKNLITKEQITQLIIGQTNGPDSSQKKKYSGQ